MTPAKPDPLSPERIRQLLDQCDKSVVLGPIEAATARALARAHLDATKREPPAGLVAVIAQQIVATFPGSPQLPSAIARAVGAFATSDAAVTKALVAWFPDYEDDYPREAARTTAEEDDQYRGEMRAAIRAALGATEESE